MMTSVVEPMSRIASHALDIDDGDGTALRRAGFRGRTLCS